VKHLYCSRSRYLINNKINNDAFYLRHETQSRTKQIVIHEDFIFIFLEMRTKQKF